MRGFNPTAGLCDLLRSFVPQELSPPREGDKDDEVDTLSCLRTVLLKKSLIRVPKEVLRLRRSSSITGIPVRGGRVLVFLFLVVVLAPGTEPLSDEGLSDPRHSLLCPRHDRAITDTAADAAMA